MSIPCKFERSVLSFEEHQLVSRSHHPEIYESGVDDLRALRQQLRDLRNKTRTLALARRREVRGKGPSRGAGFPGTAEHTLQRKQVFSAALKRVNREIDRMEKVEARTAQVKSAQTALAMRRAAQFHHAPSNADTPNEGMRPLPHQRRRTRVPPSKIGSVSQATKNAQAARDART
jgi:hypothetical protein